MQLKLPTLSLFVMLATGCATHPVPKVDQALAEAYIQKAKQNKAYEHATLYINSAEEHLALAREKVQAEENLEAQKLLERSRKDAEAALAISEAKQTRVLLEEVQAAIAVLEKRIDENS